MPRTFRFNKSVLFPVEKKKGKVESAKGYKYRLIESRESRINRPISSIRGNKARALWRKIGGCLN